MRNRWHLLAVLALFVLVSGGAVALEAGVGKAEITPPLGSPLNGYGDRMGRGAVKVHDSVWARCLYLNDGQTGVFLVTSDLCMISPELRARVLELAPKGVARENVILTATHTHSAQGGMSKALLFRTVSGRFSPDVLELTARGIADAMRVAFETRRAAVLGFGTGQQEDLSVNRRVAKGPIDPQIGVIRVNDSDGKPMAVLANFAAHPTTVGGADQMSISADFCGFYYQELEQRLPGAIAMFANGAQGNQRPNTSETKKPWAATEEVGRLLGQRVAEVAATLQCGDAILHVGYSEPELPLSMAAFAPRKTVLQTLEINDLLMSFVPGEACVEIGLDLRAKALARGYTAQFTVGLSNDYVGYFVPPDYYGQNIYENSMNFYGPRMGTWFAREFNALMTRGKAETEEPEVAATVKETGSVASLVVLEGTAYEIGRQRGTLFREVLERRYQREFADKIASGELLPKGGFWEKYSPWLDLSSLARVALGVGTRPLLQGAPLDLYEEIQGMADGAGMPFDAVWLVQSLPSIRLRENADTFFRTSFCTMLGSVGDRAGASDVLVGRNLDWSEPYSDELRPVIFDVRPKSGRRYIQIGFPWNSGVFTGMNEAGVVACVERMEVLGQPRTEGVPVEFVLRDVLMNAKTADEAAGILAKYPHLRGYHVMIADATRPAAYVVELGRSQGVRAPEKGYLAGANVASERVDELARVRYTRAGKLLEAEHIIGVARLKEVLQDQASGDSMKSIWNGSTRHSVVFEPKARALQVSFPREDGTPGEYVTVSLVEGDQS